MTNERHGSVCCIAAITREPSSINDAVNVPRRRAAKYSLAHQELCGKLPSTTEKLHNSRRIILPLEGVCMKSKGRISNVFSLVLAMPLSCLSQNRSCDTKVPDDIAAVTSALGICDMVGSIVTNNKTTRGAMSMMSQSSMLATLTAQAQVTRASLAMTSETAELDKSVARRSKQALNAGNKLGAASAIIGIIGGGAGGSLHLVNSPQVGHAATLVGISAGVIGGGIGLANSLWYSRQDAAKTTESNPNGEAAALVRLYWNAKQHIQLPADIAYKNPEAYAVVIQTMSADLEKLQLAILPMNIPVPDAQ